MAFREVPVFEVREVLRLWLADEGLRHIERLAQLDRKTVCRYVEAAVVLGLDPAGGEVQLSDELIGQVVEAVRPHRVDGHGEAWRTLVAQHEQIAAWVEDDLTAVKIHELLERRGTVVPLRTVQRYRPGQGVPRRPHPGAPPGKTSRGWNGRCRSPVACSSPARASSISPTPSAERSSGAGCEPGCGCTAPPSNDRRRSSPKGMAPIAVEDELDLDAVLPQRREPRESLRGLVVERRPGLLRSQGCRHPDALRPSRRCPLQRAALALAFALAEETWGAPGRRSAGPIRPPWPTSASSRPPATTQRVRERPADQGRRRTRGAG